MSQDKQGHVSPVELVSSAVDGEGMSQEARHHLQTCPECRRERQRIVEDLQALSRSARRFAPEPVRKVVLPSLEPERSPLRPFGWVLGLSFAAAAAAAVILILSPLHLDNPRVVPLQEITASVMADDARLMAEVSSLEENSLPEEYSAISPEASTAAGDDDPALDFVVPIDDDGGLT